MSENPNMALQFVGSVPSTGPGSVPVRPAASPRRVDPYDKVPARLRVDPRVSDRAYRLYAALVSYCWGDATECWPSNASLAEAVGGCSHDTVTRALHELVALGLVSVRVEPTVRANRIITILPDPSKP